MSSKTARLHRRQAANRKKYARLRRDDRVPQHTRAERRHAAAERERQHEADQYRQWWKRQVTLPVVTVAGAAASIVAFTPAASGIRHVHYPYSAVSQPYPYVPLDPDHPDPPHVPEPDLTFYTAYGGAGTARADRAGGLVPAEAWLPWEWTDSPNILGD